MVIYMICATRTNLVYVTIFFSLIVFFCLAAASFWRMGVGDMVTGERLVVVSLVLPYTSLDHLILTFGFSTLGIRCHSLRYQYVRLVDIHGPTTCLRRLPYSPAYWRFESFMGSAE